jgi:hypothetical protein
VEFVIIDDKDAPENLSAMTADAQEKLALIRALKPGKTAKVAVENTIAARKAFKTALTRRAGQQTPKVELEMWGDDEFVYIRLAKPKEQTSA